MALVDEIITLVGALKSERDVLRLHRYTTERLKAMGAKPTPKLKLPLLGRLYLAISPHVFAWAFVAPVLMWLYYQPITELYFRRYVDDSDSWPALAAAMFGAAAVLFAAVVGRMIRALTRAHTV